MKKERFCLRLVVQPAGCRIEWRVSGDVLMGGVLASGVYEDALTDVLMNDGHAGDGSMMTISSC